MNFEKVQLDIISKNILDDKNVSESEESILGSLLISRDMQLEGIPLLESKYFNIIEIKVVIECIIELYNNSQPIDLITVVTELRTKKQLPDTNFAVYLSQLTNRVGTGTSILFHVLKLKEHYAKKTLLETLEIARLQISSGTDIFDTILSTQNAVMDISEEMTLGFNTTTLKLHENKVQKILSLKQGEIVNPFIGIGFQKYEISFGYFEKGNLVVVAGRPGNGKTTLAISSIIANIKKGFKCLFITIEMTASELLGWFYANNSSIDNQNIRYGKVSDEELMQIIEFEKYIKQGLIEIVDLPSAKIGKVKSIIKGFKKSKNIDIVYLDYIQLVHADKKMERRDLEVGAVSRGLKESAKEQDVIIIAFAQLSREVEKTTHKRPSIEHLRESGNLEQDSDVVILIFRPEYYVSRVEASDRPQFENIFYEGQEVSSKNKVMLICAKNRNGEVGETLIHTKMNFNYFGDKEIDQYDSYEVVSSFNGYRNPSEPNPKSNPFEENTTFGTNLIEFNGEETPF